MRLEVHAIGWFAHHESLSSSFALTMSTPAVKVVDAFTLTYAVTVVKSSEDEPESMVLGKPTGFFVNALVLITCSG